MLRVLMQSGAENRVTRLALLAATVGVLGTTSCTTYRDRQKIWETAEAVDKVNATLDEYGSASVGSMVLFQPDENFKFDLKKDGDYFFEEARNGFQGRAAVLDQAVFQGGLAVSGSLDAGIAAKYAANVAEYQAAQASNQDRQHILDRQNGLKQSAASVAFRQAMADAAKESDPTKRAEMRAAAYKALADAQPVPEKQDVAFPEAPARPAPSSLEAPTADTAVGRLSSEKLAAMSGLLGDDRRDTQIPSRSAIITAAGDNATAAMFRALGRPELIQKFSDTAVVFAVTNVSVNPGWRTRKGYVSETSMGATVVWKPARDAMVKKFVGGDSHPLLRMAVAVAEGYTPHALRKLFPNDGPYPFEQVAAAYNRAVDQNELSGPHVVDGVMAATGGESGTATAMSLTPPSPALKDLSNLSQSVSSAQQALEFTGLQLERLRGTDPLPLGTPPITRNLALPADGISPQMMVISPLTDVQSLDLASSYRRRSEIALKIAAALTFSGAAVDGSAFLKYAKDLEEDVVTATPRNVINTTSSPNGHVSYQVGPQLVAVEKVKASGRLAGPAETLDRQSFPSLMVISIPQSELGIRLKVPTMQEKAAAAVAGKPEPKLQLFEPGIELSTSSRWIALEANRDDFSAKEKAKMSFELNRRVGATELMISKRTDELNKVEKLQGVAADKRAQDFGFKDVNDMRRLNAALARSGEMITKSLSRESSHRAFGASTVVELPESVLFPKPPATPNVQLAVAPAEVQAPKAGAAVMSFVLSGAKMEKLERMDVMSSDGVPVAKSDLILAGDNLIVKKAVGPTPGAIFFIVKLNDEKDTRYVSKPVLVTAPPEGISIIRKSDDGDKKKSDELWISPNTPADIAKAEVEKGKAPATPAAPKTTDPAPKDAAKAGSFEGSFKGNVTPPTPATPATK